MKIGRNAAENWEIFDQASPDDVWVHLNSFPSPHVIISEEDVCQESLYEAADACKSRSKFKNVKNIKAVYCRIKHLRKGAEEGVILLPSKGKCGFIKK